MQIKARLGEVDWLFVGLQNEKVTLIDAKMFTCVRDATLWLKEGKKCYKPLFGADLSLMSKVCGNESFFSNNLSCLRDKNNLWPISEETSCVCSFNETLAFALTLKMIKAANPRAKATSLKTVTNVGQVLRADLVKGNRKKRSFR